VSPRAKKIAAGLGALFLAFIAFAALSGSSAASFGGSRGGYSGSCPESDPLCFMGSPASAARYDAWDKARAVSDEARYNADKAFDSLRDRFRMENAKSAVQRSIDYLQVDELRYQLDQKRRQLVEKYAHGR
jgi:hypothetical protein